MYFTLKPDSKNSSKLLNQTTYQFDAQKKLEFNASKWAPFGIKTKKF